MKKIVNIEFYENLRKGCTFLKKHWLKKQWWKFKQAVFSSQKPIYTITVCEKLEPNENYYVDTGCSRVVAYRHKLKWAHEAVKSNMCNIREYVYNYAVIEEAYPFIYPHSTKRWFYKWIHDDNIKPYRGYFVEIKEPECAKHIYGFGIG